MRRTLRPMTVLVGLLIAILVFLSASPVASAQDVDEIVRELERSGYYIEPGAEGSTSSFADLVRRSESADDSWYFVSMADTVWDSFADELRDAVAPRGNVLVYFFDGDFVNVQLATDASESIEDRALAPFDENWNQPSDFMRDVVNDFDGLTGSSSSSGGGFPWLLVGIPVALVGGGVWFSSRRSRKKKEDSDYDTAQKIRTELQSELDELANDVIVLSGPVDLSDKPEAVTNYRAATDAYMDISDDIPDLEKLKDADLKELSELGARVAHARWQMDAAEAIMDGEPIPEKPKVEPPPPPAQPKPRPAQRRPMPQRQARPRVPYSRSRRRSGGGLLDILIAGGGMLGGSSRGRSRGRSSGGMFAPQPRQQRQPRRTSTSRPRSGGGVFGSGSSRSRSSSSSRSRSSGRSRGSSRRASTSRRRRR